MSLSNPNKPVTEQRLSEFYQGILPYLGGMPEMLANKFSKGDMYSTDERMIGQWIDGKPLYQKTCVMNGIVNWDTAHSWNEVGISNIEMVLSIGKVKYHYVNGSDDFWFDEHYHSSTDWASSTFGSTDFRIGGNLGSSITQTIFTLQYTKTTDSAIEIGSDTDYSTTEKIVGTWIDGKPVYQKTISFNTGAVNPGWIDIPNSLGAISGLKNIVNRFGYINYTSTNCYPLGNSNIDIRSNGNNIQYYISGADWKSKDVSITIQYTKTTD